MVNELQGTVQNSQFNSQDILHGKTGKALELEVRERDQQAAVVQASAQSSSENSELLRSGLSKTPGKNTFSVRLAGLKLAGPELLPSQPAPLPILPGFEFVLVLVGSSPAIKA